MTERLVNAIIGNRALEARVSDMPVRIGYFTIISGIGWIIDFLIFTAIVKFEIAAGYANFISASVAVSFVFFTSRRWIFRYHFGSLRSVVREYVLWNIVAVWLASWAVGAVHSLLLPYAAHVEEFARSEYALPAMKAQTLAAIVAKIFVTPLTMYSNFIALGYIIERRIRFY